MAGSRQRKLLAEGARAPEFVLRELKERLARGPVLLAFFKVSCPVCQYTFPFLERIAGAGLEIVGVSQDNAAAAREFSREYGVTFPMLIDDAAAGYAMSNAFGISSVPSLFLIEQDGTLSLSGEGFSKRDLEKAGSRAGLAPFREGERVPELRPG
ncbi:MAG: peroxiredoxin family protein [Acidobacteriota bacterium]